MANVEISPHWCLSLSVLVLLGKAWYRSVYYTHTHIILLRNGIDFATQFADISLISLCSSLLSVTVTNSLTNRNLERKGLISAYTSSSQSCQWGISGHPGPAATAVQHSRPSSLSCLPLHIGFSCLRVPSTLAHGFKYICGIRII